MWPAEMNQFGFLALLLLLFVVGLGTLAQRLKIAYPIVLVVGGLLLSLIPGLPRVALDPDLVLVVMLPPLLFSAAFDTPWRDFRRNLSAILPLAFGLVAFTTVGVAVAAHWLLPGFDWRLGLVLGAVISPTDALAATAIATRVGLPQKITSILEGESLVNDASGLVALEFAVATILGEHAPSPVTLVLKLAYMVAAGVAVGLLLGKAIYVFERWVDNAPIEITLSIIAPFLAYLGAERIEASGILSAVACGIYLGRRSSVFFSSATRIQSWATWNTLAFILNGVAFLLIGLQLPLVVSAIRGVTPAMLAFDAVVVVILVIALRLAWVYLEAYLDFWIKQRILRRPAAPPSVRRIFVVGWTGMRGVVSLAAAISLPEALNHGTENPARNVIIFLTFCVIFVTLVLQGLTLPVLIRRLGLDQKPAANPEEQTARQTMIRKALKELETLRAEAAQNASEKQESGDFTGVYDDLLEHYRARLAAAGDSKAEQHASLGSYHLYRELSNRLREVERATALKLRNENVISDAVLRRLELELDLLDIRYQSANTK